MSAPLVDAFCAVMGERDNPAPALVPMVSPFAADISYSLATAAHEGTSFSPEKRAEQERNGYAETLTAVYVDLLTHAGTPEKVALLDEEFARLRDGYRQRYARYLASRSRIMSWMIAGPSNFPVRRMEKRNRVADARCAELVEFLPRAKAAILKKLHPEWRPIMAGDADATERLEDKIAKAEALQVRMREANAAIRKHKKAGAAAQVAGLVALGFREPIAVKLLEPDFCGRIGFADYELTNNNANIRRMKERLESVANNQAKEETITDGENARLEDCPADNRIRLFFAGKPDAAARADLKSAGFRWAPSLGCWQAYRNWRSLEKAKAVAGVVAR